MGKSTLGREKIRNGASLRRAGQALDIVGLLVERRHIHARLETDQIRAVTLNSDSSPVTGHELQGTVIDMC